MIVQSISHFLASHRTFTLSLCLCLSISTVLVALPYKQVPDTSLSGEAIFKGIFFADGPFAKKIPELNAIVKLKSSLTALEYKQFLELENKVVAEIIKSNPKYFLAFEKTIKSGNRVAIQNELNRSAALVKSSIEKVTSIRMDNGVIEKANRFAKTEQVTISASKKEITDLKKKAKTVFVGTVIPDRVGSVSLVVVLLVVAVAAVVVAVALWRQVKPNQFDLNDNLTRDKLINSISSVF